MAQWTTQTTCQVGQTQSTTAGTISGGSIVEIVSSDSITGDGTISADIVYLNASKIGEDGTAINTDANALGVVANGDGSTSYANVSNSSDSFTDLSIITGAGANVTVANTTNSASTTYNDGTLSYDTSLTNLALTDRSLVSSSNTAGDKIAVSYTTDDSTKVLLAEANVGSDDAITTGATNTAIVITADGTITSLSSGTVGEDGYKSTSIAADSLSLTATSVGTESATLNTETSSLTANAGTASTDNTGLINISNTGELTSLNISSVGNASDVTLVNDSAISIADSNKLEATGDISITATAGDALSPLPLCPKIRSAPKPKRSNCLIDDLLPQKRTAIIRA